MIRYHFKAYLPVFAMVLLASPALANDIHKLVSDVEVKKDGSLLVNETIQMDATKKAALIRIISAHCPDKAKAHESSIKVLGVTDENGNKLPVRTHFDGHEETIRLDDKDIIKKSHTYNLKYVVRKAVNFLDDHPELMFDATGTEIPVRIDLAQLRIKLPAHVDPKTVEGKYYIGSTVDGTPQKLSVVGDQFVVEKVGLSPGEGLIAELDFPKGSMSPPSMLDQVKWLFDDWYLAIVLPTAAFLILWLHRQILQWKWRKYAEETLWDTPKLTPAELGTLLDERVDMPDITASLVDLAQRGYIQMRRIPNMGMFRLSEHDVEFIRNPDPVNVKPLREHENLLLKAMFVDTQKQYLGNLQGCMRDIVPILKKAVMSGLVRDGYFLRNPETDRAIFYTLAGLIGAAAFVVEYFNLLEAQSKMVGLGMILTAAVLVMAVQFIPRRTEKAVHALALAVGLRDRMSNPDKHGIDEKFAQEPTVFYRLLPYSIILQAAEPWAEAFKDKLYEAPFFYQVFRGSEVEETFSSVEFMQDLWVSLGAIQATFNAPPPREYSSFTAGPFGKYQKHI